MYMNKGQKLFRMSGLLGILLFALSQGFIFGGGPVFSFDSTAGNQSVSQKGVSPVFQSFTRSDRRVGRTGRNQTSLSFTEFFEEGDELFSEQFTAREGVGVNLADDLAVSLRFSRVPRADLPGFFLDPFRATGPNAQGCVSCHGLPVEDGGGGIEANVHRDPKRLGDPKFFIQRNAPHVFGLGALQLLAEETTSELKRIRDKAVSKARATGGPVRAFLTTSNNVEYGFIVANPFGEVDTNGVRGVDSTLIIKPFQWKGSVAFVRDFVRGATDNEIGMQSVEMFGENNDADHDGVSNELSVNQITALTIYQAAQPRPATIVELNQRDPIAFPLTSAQKSSVKTGEALFSKIGCDGCHRPTLKLRNSNFSEPSGNPDYRDVTFPSGANPVQAGLDPKRPVSFDLTADTDPGGLPFESDGGGGAIVRLFGDLRRHDMGPGLAESIDEVGTGASVWRTRELWGVGSTGPWLHDGRATTLSDAILYHGGEAQESRDRFSNLGEAQQAQLVEFLKNLVLFKESD